MWQKAWEWILCQTNKRPSSNQSKTDIYVISWFFILPTLLISSQKFTFDGQMVIFYYKKHPNTSLHPFVIYLTNLDKSQEFKLLLLDIFIRISTYFIWYAFCHIFIHTYEIKRNSCENEIFYRVFGCFL
jgi:hypothetical protein